MHNSEPLPTFFCWTRFGSEAGEPIETIVERKEAERLAGSGIFYWGIGSAVGRSIRSLISAVDRPEVLFSRIASAPRSCDIRPGHVVRWTAGTNLDGETTPLPQHVRVTSRWDPARPGTARYALVCQSVEALRLRDHGDLAFTALTNMVGGTRIGASQVTAVVRRGAESGRAGRIYSVELRVALGWPYLVRLAEPELVVHRGHSLEQGQLSLAA